jgi:hypothetical protein
MEFDDMMKTGMLIFAARVQSALQKDYGLEGLLRQPTSQFCEDFIHDWFVDCIGNSSDVSTCAFALANKIQSGSNNS